MSFSSRPRVIGHPHPRLPRALIFRREAFTLVELLVVVGIISLLVAFLLPALRKARQKAEIVSCGVHLRDLGCALAMYAATYREYPASHRRIINWSDPNHAGDPLLLQGEHAGFMGMTYPANPPYDAKPGIQDLLVQYQFTTLMGLQCTARAPGSMFTQGPDNFTWGGNFGLPFYGYCGPTAIGGVVEAYGHLSGITFRSQMGNDNTAQNVAFDYSNSHFYGCSTRNRWMRPIAVCPTLKVVFLDTLAYEPHEGMPQTNQPGTQTQGCSSWVVRRRNYLFTDGHVEYIRLDKNPGNNPP